MGGAVIGDVAADDLVLHRLAGELEVLLGELPGTLDGLAPASGEEDSVEVPRRVVREALGELDGTGMRVGPDGEEGEFLRLPGGGLGEFPAPVTGLNDEEAREAVEVAAALVIPDVGPLAPHHDGHVPLAGLVDGVPGEVHPQVALRGCGPAVVAGLRDELRCDGHRVPQV